MEKEEWTKEEQALEVIERLKKEYPMQVAHWIMRRHGNSWSVCGLLLNVRMPG